MYQYSISKGSRASVIYGLVIVSAVCSLILTIAITCFAVRIPQIPHLLLSNDLKVAFGYVVAIEAIPNIIGIPFIYKCLYTWFDKLLWRTRFIRGFVGIPDLNGTWEGVLKSSFEGGKKICMTLEIEQTWTKIRCDANFEKSSSKSNMASVFSDDYKSGVLSFAFVNNSKDLNTETQKYDGFNILEYKGDMLTGRYFNNRPNPNAQNKGGNLGVIELKRVK